MRFRFVNVVWGDAYTDAFLSVGLPSQLTPHNLPQLGQQAEGVYRIYTTRKDAETIRSSHAYQELSSVMSTELLCIDDGVDASVFTSRPYQVLSACHAHTIQFAQHEDCAFVFLSPDHVWAEGSFASLLRIAQSGRRLVTMPILRLDRETFIPAFLGKYGSEETLTPVPARELVALALCHLHPDTASLMWNPRPTNAWPSVLVWPVQSEGLLVRAFHQHPLMVRPVRKDIVPKTTIDDDYVLHACPNSEELYTVEDSDEICAFEYCAKAIRCKNALSHRLSEHEVSLWASRHTHLRHLELVTRKHRIHCKDVSDSWRSVEEDSDAAVAAILKRMGLALAS